MNSHSQMSNNKGKQTKPHIFLSRKEKLVKVVQLVFEELEFWMQRTRMRDLGKGKDVKLP